MIGPHYNSVSAAEVYYVILFVNYFPDREFGGIIQVKEFGTVAIKGNVCHTRTVKEFQVI